MLILETPRLRLRWFTPADAGFVLRLLNDRGWIEAIGDRGVRTRRQAEFLILAERPNGETGGQRAGKCLGELGGGIAIVTEVAFQPRGDHVPQPQQPRKDGVGDVFAGGHVRAP